MISFNPNSPTLTKQHLESDIMTTQEWLDKNKKGRTVIPSVMRFGDGNSVSVQASARHYCLPREDRGPYTHVELGFPTFIPELVMHYCEEPERPMDTVYGYVPIGLVDSLANLHGGIV